MTASLCVEEGPLSEAGLAAIARMYGRVDSRYATVDFCRRVFNGNPLGWSLHAFIRAEDTEVGHYAVVPVRIRARGGLMLSGKGEALFLEDTHRNQTIESPDGSVPAGIALMRAVHARALARGVQVLHNITSREIGMLQRMEGFRLVRFHRDQHHALLDVTRFPFLHGTPWRRAGGEALAAGQWALHRMAALGPSLHRKVAVDVDAPEALAILLRTVQRDPADPDHWTVSRDQETLQWQWGLERFEVLTTRSDPDAMAVVTRGSSREMLYWNNPHEDPVVAGAFLNVILARARSDGAAIVSVGHDLVASSASLGRGLRKLGFLRWPFPGELYVRSSDPFFLDPKNLMFDRMFNL